LIYVVIGIIFQQISPPNIFPQIRTELSLALKLPKWCKQNHEREKLDTEIENSDCQKLRMSAARLKTFKMLFYLKS